MQAASTYRADGGAALGCVLDADQLETAREALTKLIPNHRVKGPYASIVHDAWRKAPALAELVPRVGATACAAAGVPSLVLFHEHLLYKAPGGDDPRASLPPIDIDADEPRIRWRATMRRTERWVATVAPLDETPRE
jgi:hypothetical protein